MKKLSNLFVLIILASFFSGLSAQHITGTYSVTVPEAGLFFINPAYLNPATGGGVMGSMTNPASLRNVQGSELAFAFTLPQQSDSEFEFEATDSSEVYDPITLNSRLQLKETGGLSGLGIAFQKDRWRFGLVLVQPRKTGLSLKARGEVDLSTHFTMERPITREDVPDLPVGEIPVEWDIESQVRLALSGHPAELSFSILPIVFSTSYSLGPLHLGAGLTYHRYDSSDETASLQADIVGTATITGTPYGEDSYFGVPYGGSMTADFSLNDNPVSATYRFDLSGSRFSATLGSALQFGPIAFGASYTRGFKSKITANYDLTTIYTSGLPEDIEMPEVEVDVGELPNVSGYAQLNVANFAKDTLSSSDNGSLTLGGTHRFSLGMHLLIFGVFFNGEYPERVPDFTSISFGVYTDFPIPFTPVRFNAGFLTRTDGIASKVDEMTPYRVVSHLGAGVAVKLPLLHWVGWGEKPGWLRLGVRSSLTSYAMGIFEQEADEAQNKQLPSLTDNLAISLGLETSF